MSMQRNGRDPTRLMQSGLSRRRLRHRKIASRRKVKQLSWCATLIWAVLSVRSHLERAHNVQTNQRSAVHTPYHLTPGGGERVVLTFVRKIQQVTGHHVDLLVVPENVCSKKKCAVNLAAKLGVGGIDWERVTVKLIASAAERYSVWWAMGNSLLPDVAGRGVYNIYHCQFPFDGFSADVRNVKKLSSYDTVYLNSEYTNHWYRLYLKHVAQNRTENWPRVIHFPPPFSLVTRVDNSFATMTYRIQIVLVGRVFEGTQSKRHMLAIDAFEQLMKRVTLTDKEVKLTLIGNIATGYEKYSRRVKARASEVDGVNIMFNAANSEVRGILENSHIVWSLTGLEKSKDLTNTRLPADAEHFGLALLECMSAGLVPVVTRRGGPVEIVRNLPSFLAVASLSELIDSTASLLSMQEEEFALLRSRSREEAVRMSGMFDAQSTQLFTLFGRTMEPTVSQDWLSVFNLIKSPGLQNPTGFHVDVSEERCPDKNLDKRVLLFIDDRFDLALQAIFMRLSRRNLRHWRLHLFTSNWNKDFVLESAANFPCIVQHDLQDFLHTVTGIDPRRESEYQQMWKSEKFWSALGETVETVLTFQSDAWFPSNGNFDPIWLKYDYVGAPWCHEGNWGYLDPGKRPKEAEHMLHTTRQIPFDVRVGNGGISLRRVPTLKSIIAAYGTLSPAQENEDVFFAVHSYNKFNVPSVEYASSFGLEIICGDILHHQHLLHTMSQNCAGIQGLPFAVHKPFDILDNLLAKKVERECALRTLFS